MAIAAWLAVAMTCSASVPSSDIWMTATMDGRKVGYLHYLRTGGPVRVVTVSTLHIRFARTHNPLNIRNRIREVAGIDGRPLSFASWTRLSDQSSSTRGKRIGPGTYQVRVKVGSRSRIHRMSWPRDALLDEGMRRAIVAHGFKPGTRYALSRFNDSSLSATRLQMRVVGRETVDLPGDTRELVHLRQTRRNHRSSQVTDLWVDAHGDVLKIGMPLLGFRLELLACSKACAMQPDQDVDVLEHAMLLVPIPLPEELRDMPLRFIFQVASAQARPFINTDTQRVRRYGPRTWVVDTILPHKGRMRAPLPGDTQANDWLQSDAPAIRALARKAAGKATNDKRRMQRLTRFVRHYLTVEGTNVGYASALETLHSRRGDCTEHAVLLAALARAEDIPARVVTGLAYADHYNGQSQVLVPHTWVQAWVGGLWMDYDAAMPGYDHAHIAMAVGDGDPWKYFSGISALGSIRLLRVQPGSTLGEGRPLSPSAPSISGHSPGFF